MSLGMDENTQQFAFKLMATHLQSILDEMDGVKEGKDIEYIHRMRVASRRLRNVLRLFEKQIPAKKVARWTKEVRLITRSLGLARDADVQIEWLHTFITGTDDKHYHPGMQRIFLRLSQTRNRLQTQVQKGLERFQKSAVAEDMQAHFSSVVDLNLAQYAFSPSLYQLSENWIEYNLGRVLAFDDIVYHPEQVKELHMMRIETKHLRYTLETFSPLYPGQLKRYIQATKNFQENLGDIHDCDVWMDFIPGFIDEERGRLMEFYGHTHYMSRLIPGIRYFEENRRVVRRNLFDQFGVEWGASKESDLWSSLRELTRIPLLEYQHFLPSIPGSH